MAEDPRHPPDMPRLVVMMGVCGCGKSLLGRRFASHAGAEFVDGDDLHPASNIAKMSAGEALTDDDRWPWLAAIGSTMSARPGRVVFACSALRRAYRDAIAEAAGETVVFVHLDAPRDVILKRMADRKGHFMPTALVDSQFATLEPVTDEPNAICVDATEAPYDLVRTIADRLRRVRVDPL